MAMLLLFAAVAHEGNISRPSQPFYEPEREFLPVVLYGRVLLIHRPVCEHLLSVTSNELRPFDLLVAECSEQLLARSQFRHPHVVTRLGQPPPTKACDQNPHPVTLLIDWTPHAFRSEHLRSLPYHPYYEWASPASDASTRSSGSSRIWSYTCCFSVASTTCWNWLSFMKRLKMPSFCSMRSMNRPSRARRKT